MKKILFIAFATLVTGAQIAKADSWYWTCQAVCAYNDMCPGKGCSGQYYKPKHSACSAGAAATAAGGCGDDLLVRTECEQNYGPALECTDQ